MFSVTCLFLPGFIFSYFCNEEQTSERIDDVSPLSNGQLYICSREKIPTTFAHIVGLFERSEFLIDTSQKENPSACVCVSVCVRLILVLVWKKLSWF